MNRFDDCRGGDQGIIGKQDCRRQVGVARQPQGRSVGFGFSRDKKTLLVLGGSQGAESINRLFLSSLSYWNDPMKQQIQVLHLCGRMKPADAEKDCARSSVQARAFSFFDRMDLAYSVADLCLGRAGATFLAEIEAKALPAILIPYPFGDGHQRENARVFAQRHAAVVGEQSELTPESLAETLKDSFRRSQDRRDGFETRPYNASNARVRLADFLEECASL